MGAYFLDTSAIVKRYVYEQGQSLLLDLCDPKQGHDLYVSQAALVEVVAAFCRRAHDKSISTDQRDALIILFREHARDVYGIRFVTTAMYTAAGDLCRFHRLRAYDAVQLACALDLLNETRAKQAPEPTFVCADINLLNIAIAEGLNIENPNNYQ